MANLAHRLANIAETIGELLEVLGVLSNVHVALDKTPELGLKVDCAMKFVVAELGVDAVPDAVGGGVRRANDGAHVLGDRVVQPTQDALIEMRHLGSRRWIEVGGGETWEVRPNLPRNVSKKQRHSS